MTTVLPMLPTISREDHLIGQRVRQARIEAGFTQMDLARTFDISHQQIQKFERGLNRISAKMLHKLAELLSKPMNWFTQDLDGDPVDSPVTNEQIRFSLTAMRYLQQIVTAHQRQRALKLLAVFVEGE